MLIDCPDRSPQEYTAAWKVKALRAHEAALAERCFHVPKPAPHPLPPLPFAARLVMVECPPDIAVIARRAAVLFGVQSAQVMTNGRHKGVSEARAVTAFAARRLLRCSYPALARAMCMPNHSSAISAVGKVKREIERERQAD